MAYQHPTLSIGDQVEYRPLVEGKPSATATVCFVSGYVPVREAGVFVRWDFNLEEVNSDAKHVATIEEIRASMILMRQFVRKM